MCVCVCVYVCVCVRACARVQVKGDCGNLKCNPPLENPAYRPVHVCVYVGICACERLFNTLVTSI